jgi:hypothetical protein
MKGERQLGARLRRILERNLRQAREPASVARQREALERPKTKPRRKHQT